MAADPALDALWNLPGGRTLVAMHAVFPGAAIPAAEVARACAVGPEGFRAALAAARDAGLLEFDELRVTFAEFAAGSERRARLEAGLETRGDEMRRAEAELRSRFLLWFLGAPPGETQ